MRTRKGSALRYRVEPLEPRLLLAADWAAGLATHWSPEAELPPSDIDLLVSLPAPGERGAEPGQVQGIVSELPPALDLEALRRLGEANGSDSELPGFELAPYGAKTGT